MDLEILVRYVLKIIKVIIKKIIILKIVKK